MSEIKIAIIFDFDETLVSDSTTQLLEKYSIDTDEFWDTKHASLGCPHGCASRGLKLSLSPSLL